MTVDALREQILGKDTAAIVQAEQVGSPALPVLTELIVHPDSEVRALAVGCLSVIRDDDVPALLARALGDKDEDVYVRAMQILSARDLDLAILSPLGEHTGHPDPRIRESVALLLGRFDNQTALAPLTAQLGKETEPEAARGLRLALARLGDETCKQEIAERLGAAEASVRLQTLDDLEYVGDKRLAGKLLPLLSDLADGYEIGELDEPKLARICDAVVNLVSKWYGKPFQFEVSDLKKYSDEEIEETRKFLTSLGE